jgi:spoIIIJ-associated protein
MEWVETTGRTIEEARDAALDMLGVDESDAEFVTLSEPRPGLFGRLRGEARVRARVMPTTPPPKRNRSRRPVQRRGPANQRSDRSDADDAREPRAAAARSAPANDDGDAEQSLSDGTSASGTGKSRSSRRSRRPAGGGGAGATALAESLLESTDGSDGAGAGSADDGNLPNDSPARRSQRSSRTRRQASSDSRPEEATVTETLSLEEQGDMAKQFVEGLVDQLGLEASVTARPLDDEAVQVAVDGEELGILVGQGGVTLAALQELTRTVVQRKAGGHTDRILVDVAGYRARRAEALGRFTAKVVAEVTDSGSEKALEAMSPADRKVVHDTVNELGGASTRSEGVEPHRYVVISPIAGSSSEVSGSNDAGNEDDAENSDSSGDLGEGDG